MITMLIGESCTFRKRSFKVGPSSSVITIPRGLGIEPGDEVEVTIKLTAKSKNHEEDDRA